MRISSIALIALLASVVVACDESSPSGPPLEGNLAVDAGAIQLRVIESPWQMLFYDAEGQLVLREHSGTSSAPTGSLGLHVGPLPGGDDRDRLPAIEMGEPATPPERDEGWIHATELLSSRTTEGGAFEASIATTDDARTIELVATTPREGVIEVRVSSPNGGAGTFGVGFTSEPGERFVGFGERGNAVNQSGNAVENFVAEGPYQDREYIFIEQLVPLVGVRWRADTTYYPIPWLLSSRGYGVLLENDELSYHRVGSESDDAWSMEVEATEMRFSVYGGPSPAEALSRYTDQVGTQPRGSFTPWFLGPWLQSDSDDRFDELRDADVPTSVAATYLHYLPCGRQQGQEERQIERTAALNEKGVAVHTYFNPMICVEYEPAFSNAEDAGALLKHENGETYIYDYSTSTTFEVSQFDFSAPNGVAQYKSLTDEALSHGYEGWMEDFGEYTPLDAVAYDGVTGTAYHNRYPRDYHCGAQEATREFGRPLARFARSGWTGSAACSPVVWGGDPTCGFAFDGLESSLYQALSMGTSGVGIWGSDIGGFFALFGNALSGEMLDRWIGFGGLSVVMRSQKDGIAVPDPGRPQPWDDAHLPVWRRYSKLHTQLYPYLLGAVEVYYATGLPVMRHHVLTHPADADATMRDDQYMFGPHLLVAPVYREGATDREVYLPAGTWAEWWRSVDYDETDGSFDLGAAVIHEGQRSVTVTAPTDEIPLFVSAGAVIPLLAPDVWTLTDHGDDPSIVHLADRDDQLHLRAFPRGESDGMMYQTEAWSSREGEGAWTLALTQTRARSITLEATLRTLESPFEPCSVSLDGVAVPDGSWSFDAGTGVLRVEYEAGDGVLIVNAC